MTMAFRFMLFGIYDVQSVRQLSRLHTRAKSVMSSGLWQILRGRIAALINEVNFPLKVA